LSAAGRDDDVIAMTSQLAGSDVVRRNESKLLKEKSPLIVLSFFLFFYLQDSEFLRFPEGRSGKRLIKGTASKSMYDSLVKSRELEDDVYNV